VDYSQPISYTPKHLAEKILAARTTIEGERKQVTVLFADVKGFTSISEKLDPEEVQTLISECLVFFTEEIHRYEGAIAQFLGDGVMALFGAPIAHEDAPQRALYAALAIRERLREYSEKLKKQGIDFNMRIGLNTGLVVVGRIGDDLTMEYTAMGDTVNLASRMESTAQPGTIQVSENTYHLIEGYFEFKPLGEIELKGKRDPVKAYQLLGAGQAKTRLGVSVARGLTPFVGREKEIEHLKDCYARVKEGQGQLVGIVGEPGVGKSRLLLQLRSVLPSGEYGYLEGDCLRYGGSIAYLPFLDMLRAYFDSTEGEQESLVKNKIARSITSLDEKLLDILPPLQDVLSLKVQDEEYLKLEPQQRREQVFEAIRALLIRESLNRPLILAIEDLHWIDKTSEELLTYLIDGLANTHILLILLYRPEYIPVWVSKSYYSQIRVDQLPTSSSSDLVQAILEGGEIAEELRALIMNRASGNPLFIEEFTRTLLERGYIQRKDGHYVLNVKPSDIQVPDTVQGIIAARIDSLEANLKRTMQVASVIGRDFAYRILQSITGVQRELKSSLLNLAQLEFIYEKSLFPELEYIFKHALTQEVAYNSLLLKRRRKIHETIGQAIEDLYPQRLEEFCEILAHHYSRSENWKKAYQYLKSSGDKATRNYSLSEAFRFYKEAMNALNRLPDTKDNKQRGIAVRLSALSPILNLVYPEDSLQILQDGANLSSELGDPKSMAIFNSRIGTYYAYQGDTYKGVDYCEKSFQSAVAIDEVEIAIPNAQQLCNSYFVIGNYQKLIQVAREAIAMIESKHREADYFGTILNIYSGICGHCGHALGTMGHFEEGISLCEKSLSHAQREANLYGIALSEFNYGFLFIHRGDGEKARPHLEESIRIFEKTQIVLLLGLTLTGLGRSYNLLGELRLAQECIEKGLKLQKQAGLRAFLSYHYYCLSSLQFDSGWLDHALKSAEEALELSRNNNERVFEGLSSITMGRVLTADQDVQYDECAKYIFDGMKILNEQKIEPYVSQGLLFLAELNARKGNQEKALEYLANSERAFEKMGMEYWLAKARNLANNLKTGKERNI
jgi:class 3 adenylate cyclase/tetratricopeptide (TPR) repeat protein